MAEFVARERRWAAVDAPSPPDYDNPEESAAGTVLHLLIAPELAATGWNATARLDQDPRRGPSRSLLGLGPSELRADGISFEEDGDLISPWPIKLAIARRAAERDPHTESSALSRERRPKHDAKRRTVPGTGDARPRTNTSRRRSARTWTRGTDGQLVRVLLREWCGANAVDLHAEISSLREEAARAPALAHAAVELLRRHGHPRDAHRLERELADRRHATSAVRWDRRASRASLRAARARHTLNGLAVLPRTYHRSGSLHHQRPPNCTRLDLITLRRNPRETCCMTMQVGVLEYRWVCSAVPCTVPASTDAFNCVTALAQLAINAA